MTATSPTELDPKGLIREAFKIDGITASECRSIFLDWALSLPVDADTGEAIRKLLDHYRVAQNGGAQAHPMIQVLVDGAASAARPAVRRGGRAARVKED